MVIPNRGGLGLSLEQAAAWATESAVFGSGA